MRLEGFDQDGIDASKFAELVGNEVRFRVEFAERSEEDGSYSVDSLREDADDGRDILEALRKRDREEEEEEGEGEESLAATTEEKEEGERECEEKKEEVKEEDQDKQEEKTEGERIVDGKFSKRTSVCLKLESVGSRIHKEQECATPQAVTFKDIL